MLLREKADQVLPLLRATALGRLFVPREVLAGTQSMSATPPQSATGLADIL